MWSCDSLIVRASKRDRVEYLYVYTEKGRVQIKK